MINHTKHSIGNLFRKLFQGIRVKYTMESETENYLYHSHEKLRKLMRLKGRDAAVQEYLENVKYAPIADFKKGLEWFNVSEPLSFEKHLKGKLVLLDFFTYCCINCMHILPDLCDIEYEFPINSGLVVIGVHSAKFENEKISSNILAAVQRYNIKHPVVNDANSEIWKSCDVHCWPTLLLLGPNGNPIIMLTGEGHKDQLFLIIRNALKYYNEKNLISDHDLPIKSAFHLLPSLKGPLLFPGKITSILDQNNHEILAVSDTGNNRILIMKEDGTILQQIGGLWRGFKDGTLEEAEFNHPQGLVFQNRDILFVADTENHAIRKIDLANRKVETYAANREPNEDEENDYLDEPPIKSPWDVCIYRTADMDLTFHPNGRPPLRDVLLIAMAGSHQIWALFLEDTVWWKCKKYRKGVYLSIVGSGKEENRNNSYPHAASFAQPSGLALCNERKLLFIADSESSSVRRLSLVDGKVCPVVGGDRNPLNLFAFGDKDGTLFEAKLQHALGVAATKDEKTVFVADTYNHKLKKIDTAQNSVQTMTIPGTTDGESHPFNEPGGLCVSSDNKKIYLADTNNHAIKIIHLNSTYDVTKLEKMSLKGIGLKNTINKDKYHILSHKTPINISENGGKFVLSLILLYKDGLDLTPDAPQDWSVDLPGASWSFILSKYVYFEDIELIVDVPPGKEGEENFVDILFDIITCNDDTCLPRNILVRIPVKNSKSGKTNISVSLKLSLSPSKVELV